MNKLQKFVSRIFGIKVGETSSGIVTSEEPGYVKITQRDIKGLDMITRDRQLKIVFNLYMKEPFAKTIIDTINDFVFGDGFSYSIEFKNSKTPKYKETQAMEILDRFWKINKFDLRLEKKGIDLSLNGMLCLPVFVNKQGGEVRLGFADPQNIDTVVVNPLNVEDAQVIKFKTITGQTKKTLTVIKEDLEDVFSDSYELLNGECFFFPINNVSNQPEGISDLLVSADMIDMTSSLLYNILKHSELSYLMFQDVTVKGSIDPQEWAKKNPIPNPGERIVHNDKVEIKLLTPDIKANNSTEIVRLFKNIILLSKRMPEHWFSDGGNTNLATAVEQGTAVFRLLKNRQQYWVYILEQILMFVLHQAYINKKEGFSLTREDLINNIKIKVLVPEFETKNLDKVSKSINEIADFLNKGIEKGLITKDTAGKIFRSLTELFGFTINEDVEIEKLLAEVETKIKEAKESEPVPGNEPEPESDNNDGNNEPVK